MGVPRRIHILYEDRRGPVTGFGPHELLVSCVWDELAPSMDRADVKARLNAIPKKGDARLLAACVEDVSRIGARGEPVVALFDEDRVRTLLPLQPTTRKRDVARAVRTKSSGPAQLVVWLLVRNTETLVSAAATCLGSLPPSKRPPERDRVLLAAAWGERGVRDRVRADVPTFDCFVRGVARLWACP